MTPILYSLACVLALAADPQPTQLQGLAFGIPPAGEDPVIYSTAPEKCMFYVNWNGTGAPDIRGGETEKLLAEPEGRNFWGRSRTLGS